jgi:hypothetical protein
MYRAPRGQVRAVVEGRRSDRMLVVGCSPSGLRLQAAGRRNCRRLWASDRHWQCRVLGRRVVIVLRLPPWGYDPDDATHDPLAQMLLGVGAVAGVEHADSRALSQPPLTRTISHRPVRRIDPPAWLARAAGLARRPH